MNRYKLLLSVFSVILLMCVLFVSDAYISGAIILISILGLIYGFMRIESQMNENEKRFFNKLGE